jgi:acetolactate synthase-1/2/3 large subunit
MIGKNFQPEVGMVCHGAEFIRAFADCAAVPEKKDRSAWISELHGYAATQAVWKNIQAPDGVAFGNVVRALGELTPDATSIVPDAGISAALAYKFFPFKGKRKLYSTMSGVMGYGVPGAVAIAMREPERTVVCLVGDGGFMMTGNELAVAVERKLPVKIFLSNNRSLGTIRLHQERMYPGRSHATDLTGPDFSKLAQAFGCETLLIERDEDVEPMIRAALAAAGPVFVEVKASLSAILPKA